MGAAILSSPAVWIFYMSDYQNAVMVERHRSLTDRDAATLQVWLTTGYFELVGGSATH